MRIGIDIDGCVRDIHNKLRQVYNREMNGEHWCDPIEKWKKYDIKDNFSIGDGIYDFWFKTHAEEIYTKSLPFPEINEINSLISFGYDIIIITDQPNLKTKEYTLQWINNHIPYHEIHFTSKKYLVSCDFYLDDNPIYLESFKSHLLDCVIMDRPWNRWMEGNRINNLTEFKELILKGIQ